MDKKSEAGGDGVLFNVLEKRLPHILKNIESPRSIETKNKNRIYENIAEFLRDKYGGERNKAMYMSAAYILCNEPSPDFVRERATLSKSIKLSEKARESILTIKVHYKISDSREETICITEIYYVENGSPCVSRVKESVLWENLPEQVREHNLKSKSSEISLNIFPE